MKKAFFIVGLGTICAAPGPHLPGLNLKGQNKALAHQSNPQGDILVNSWALPVPAL